MNKFEIVACAFESWYPNFDEHTIKRFTNICKLTLAFSVIIDLPEEIVNYIKNAPLALPKKYFFYYLITSIVLFQL